LHVYVVCKRQNRAQIHSVTFSILASLAADNKGYHRFIANANLLLCSYSWG